MLLCDNRGFLSVVAELIGHEAPANESSIKAPFAHSTPAPSVRFAASRAASASLPSLFPHTSLAGLASLDEESFVNALCTFNEQPDSDTSSGSSSYHSVFSAQSPQADRDGDGRMSGFTLEQLDKRRFELIRKGTELLRELNDLHRFGREHFHLTSSYDKTEDRHQYRKTSTRSSVQTVDCKIKEQSVRLLDMDLGQIESALRLRGAFTPAYDYKFLASKPFSELYTRHFRLWQRYQALYERKGDLQFTLGALDGPFEFKIPPNPVSEGRIAIVRYLCDVDRECGRIVTEMEVLERVMYK